jgi:predicted GIY-YIG superfamily endonuclease
MNGTEWFVYILRCADGTLYTGTAADVDRRAAVHNSGRGAKYTRSRRPVEVIYRERCGGKSEALRREAAVKRLTRAEKLALVASGNKS